MLSPFHCLSFHRGARKAGNGDRSPSSRGSPRTMRSCRDAAERQGRTRRERGQGCGPLIGAASTAAGSGGTPAAALSHSSLHSFMSVSIDVQLSQAVRHVVVAMPASRDGRTPAIAIATCTLPVAVCMSMVSCIWAALQFLTVVPCSFKLEHVSSASMPENVTAHVTFPRDRRPPCHLVSSRLVSSPLSPQSAL